MEGRISTATHRGETEAYSTDVTGLDFAGRRCHPWKASCPPCAGDRDPLSLFPGVEDAVADFREAPSTQRPGLAVSPKPSDLDVCGLGGCFVWPSRELRSPLHKCEGQSILVS